MHFLLLNIFIFLFSFSIVKSELSLISAKDIYTKCEKNLFKIIIDVSIINPTDDYTEFYLGVFFQEKEVLFKCIIDPVKSKIICMANLHKQKMTLQEGDELTLPYPFPLINNIMWEYVSFVDMIYRRSIKIVENCGESVLRNNITTLKTIHWDLVTKVNKIYGGECRLSDTEDNFYSFYMNISILGGNIKNQFDESIKEKVYGELDIMQNITMPFYLGSLNSFQKNIKYDIHKYYKMAFCHPISAINTTNYENGEDIKFHCNIPISDEYIFNGPLKVFTFSDNVYSRLYFENDNNSTVDFVSIYFTTQKNPILGSNQIEFNDEDDINTDDDMKKDDVEEGENNQIFSTSSSSSSSPSSSSSSSSSSSTPSSSSSTPSSSSSSSPSSSSTPSSSSSSSPSSSSPSSSSSSQRLRALQYTPKKKKKEFLLLDDRKNNYICPDMPVFEINDLQKGIIYEPIMGKGNKYSIILNGYLKNGYQITDKTINKLEYTKKEIKFNLSVVNNLVEEDKKKNIQCSLTAGSMFLEKETVNIKCIGEKNSQVNFKNTDITVNWLTKENKYLKNIVIKWPKSLGVHSKKIYSYDIVALSIKKSDHGCFENNYYFYINIIDLKSEPDIYFKLPMESPDSINANCKLYRSNTLKCFLDLNLRKINKNAKIRLPPPGIYNISTNEGNYINLTVLSLGDNNEPDLYDEGIKAEEACGDYKVVGAIKNIGYNYSTTILIICTIFFCVIVIVTLISICITCEIKNRGKRKFYPHTDEPTIGAQNTSVNKSTISNA